MENNMNIKDYLHLYLGCDGITEYHHVTSYDEGGDVSTAYRGKHVLDISLLKDFDGVESKIKLLLRPLSDMTEEEGWDIISHLHAPFNQVFGTQDLRDMLNPYNDPQQRCSPKLMYEVLPFVLAKGFDLFGLIDAGLAIDKSKIVTNGKAGDLEASNG